MRLDKFLSTTATATRSEAGKAARKGQILVNGVPIKDPSVHIDPDMDVVEYCGEKISYRRYTYVMLNKPMGYVSATEDGRDKTVLELLPEKLRGIGLFPCGRLDKNTVGLMLLTDDGELGHKLLAPKNHVSKTYGFKCEAVLSPEDVERLENGVYIAGGYLTKPAKVRLDPSGTEGKITITEGKYHQIKLMLEAVKNKITELERLTFGPLVKDDSLARGEWRYLSDTEIEMLREHCIKEKRNGENNGHY